jgi:hypothetical protein
MIGWNLLKYFFSVIILSFIKKIFNPVWFSSNVKASQQGLFSLYIKLESLGPHLNDC